VVKGGMISWSAMGDPNASIPTVEPVLMRPMFGAMNPGRSITWVSRISVENGAVGGYGLKRRVEPVRNCRKIGKRDMKWNDAMPKMKVDPERYVSSSFVLFVTCPWTIEEKGCVANFSAPSLDCRGGWHDLHCGTGYHVASGAVILRILITETFVMWLSEL
jgi:urease